MRQLHRQGLTLLEVLIVLAILAFLAMLFLPVTRNVRGAAEVMACANNLKAITLGIHRHQELGSPRGEPGSDTQPSSRETCYPTGCMGPGNAPEDRLSWMVTLLPHLDQNALYQQLNLEKGYPENRATTNKPIREFLCPAQVKSLDQSSMSITTYVAMSGIGLDAASRPAGAPGNGFMGYDRKTTPSMIRDGLANTIALMETESTLGPWARSGILGSWAQGGIATVRGFDLMDLPITGNGRPFHQHLQSIQVAFADGSCRRLNSSINPDALATLITIEGGEPPQHLD